LTQTSPVVSMPSRLDHRIRSCGKGNCKRDRSCVIAESPRIRKHIVVEAGRTPCRSSSSGQGLGSWA
jgi:hypothetical protein